MQIVNSACRVRQLTPPVVKNNIRALPATGHMGWHSLRNRPMEDRITYTPGFTYLTCTLLF